MIAIFKRDFKAYFQTPLGFVFLSAFFFFSAIPFRYILSAGSNYISGIYSSNFLIYLLLLCLLTMNLLSDEKRHKTDQAIFTSPVSVLSVVLGKYLAAATVYTIALMITVLYALIMCIFVVPDFPLFFCGFLGMYLSGLAVIAIGLFISSLTESQVISAVITCAVVFFIMMVDSLSQIINTDKLDFILDAISFHGRFNSFVVGMLDVSNIVFFISVIILFLFFTDRMLERRKWA